MLIFDSSGRRAQWFCPLRQAAIPRRRLRNRALDGRGGRPIAIQLTRGGHRFFVGLKWLAKDGLLLFGGGRRVRDRGCGRLDHGTLGAGHGHKVLSKHFDEVGREQTHHAPVTP